MPSEKGLTKNHHTLSQTNSESTHKTLSRLEQMQRNMFDFWAKHTVQYIQSVLYIKARNIPLYPFQP